MHQSNVSAGVQACIDQVTEETAYERNILRAAFDERNKAQSRCLLLEDALHKIDANAGESVEWIRRVAREALTKANFPPPNPIPSNPII